MEGQVVILCTGSVVSLLLCSLGLSLLSSWEMVPTQAVPLNGQVCGKLEIRGVLCMDFVVLFAAAHRAGCSCTAGETPLSQEGPGFLSPHPDLVAPTEGFSPWSPPDPKLGNFTALVFYLS